MSVSYENRACACLLSIVTGNRLAVLKDAEVSALTDTEVQQWTYHQFRCAVHDPPCVKAPTCHGIGWRVPTRVREHRPRAERRTRRCSEEEDETDQSLRLEPWRASGCASPTRHEAGDSHAALDRAVRCARAVTSHSHMGTAPAAEKCWSCGETPECPAGRGRCTLPQVCARWSSL